jgi:hypothetical protein
MGDVRFIHNFVGKSERKKPFGRLGTGTRIILKQMLKKQCEGFIWLRVRSKQQAVVSMVMNIWSPLKPASQEEPCAMELV